MFGLKFRQIFFLLLLAAAIFAGSRIIPVEFRAFQFSDSVYAKVKYAASNRKTIEKIRTEIVDEAKADNIPVTARDIVITRHGPSFTIDIEYQLPFDLYLFHRDRKFHVNVAGEIFEK